VTRALAATLLAALVLIPAAGTHGIKEGGTYKVAVLAGFFNTIDPALRGIFTELFVLEPACGTLMAYPSKPPPAGLEIAPELAADHPVVSRDGRTYTFTIRKDARFSDGKPVTARAFSRAIERILDPAMKSAFGIATIVGADDVLAGKAKSPTGVTARGRTLTLRLTKRDPGLLEALSFVCAVPPALPVDPEGVKAPLPSPAPYSVAQYVPGERLVLERNRFYKGARMPHVSRYQVDLRADEGSIVDDIASGKVDTGYVTAPTWAERAGGLAQRYGVNKSRFFVAPGGGLLRMFVLNTSRPLFRNNPKLRQAINYAVDRKALTRELGPFAATPMDQYLRLRDEKIYPLTGPDLRTARKLAKGRTRGGRAVLYTRPDPADVAQAQILKKNLKAIGIEVEIVAEFAGQLIFEKLATGQKEFDIGRVAWSNDSPSILDGIFGGGTIGTADNINWSYFDSTKYNRVLAQAARLTGAERYRAYAELDIQISRDAAPAIPVAQQNAIFFVSARTGCIVGRPWLDLTAVCLK
jgi:ABC-type transport system substrate-binding protein